MNEQKLPELQFGLSWGFALNWHNVAVQYSRETTPKVVAKFDSPHFALQYAKQIQSQNRYAKAHAIVVGHRTRISQAERNHLYQSMRTQLLQTYGSDSKDAALFRVTLPTTTLVRTHPKLVRTVALERVAKDFGVTKSMLRVEGDWAGENSMGQTVLPVVF